MRFLVTLTINRRLHLLKLNINIAGRTISFYLLMVSPLVIAFVFISWTVWGPYYIYYRRFGLSVVNNLLFTIGFSNSVVQLEINIFWTVLFYVLFLLFSIFMISCAFVGIYMDAYREVKILEGYRDEVKAWAFLDYLLWILGCFKKKKLRFRIEEYLKKRKERSQQGVKGDEKDEEPREAVEKRDDAA